MALLVPNNGEGDAASFFVGKSNPTDLILKLYTNNITPAETDTAGSYTEATFAGYSAISLTGASWTVTEGAPTSAAYAQQTFTRSSTGTVENQYGYYMIRTTSGRIALAERFTGAPFAVTNSGDNIKITPTITFD